MSDFHISVNNSQNRMIFFLEIVLKLFFIHLWSIAIKLCLIFSEKGSEMSITGSDVWSWPKMSGFIKSNVRDPRSRDPDFLEI
jgi:hypothetical protein